MTSACCKFEMDCRQLGRLDHSLSVNEEIAANEEFESLAFSICETDSNPGLSWAEIEECEVSFILLVVQQ